MDHFSCIIMPYHFIFREVIYYDDVHRPYEVPDYLSCDDTWYQRHCVTYKYSSRDYDTMWQALSDFYDVVMDSGISSSPEFYVNDAFMGDSTELFNKYIKAIDAEE